MLDDVARLEEASVRSIADGFLEDESILVLRLRGVRTHIELLLIRASAMDLPALLGSSLAFAKLESPLVFHLTHLNLSGEIRRERLFIGVM